MGVFAGLYGRDRTRDSRYRPRPMASCLYVLYGHYVDNFSVYALVTYGVQAYVRHQKTLGRRCTIVIQMFCVCWKVQKTCYNCRYYRKVIILPTVN